MLKIPSKSNGYYKPRETLKDIIHTVKEFPISKHDTFIHEAGHTVLCFVEGVQFDYVHSHQESGKVAIPYNYLTLEQQEQGGLDFLSYPKTIITESAYSFSRIYLAGVEAEIIHSNHLDEGYIVYKRSEQDFSNANKILNLVNKKYDLYYCRMSARYILFYYWGLVIKISDALKKQGVLKQEDLNKILKQRYYHCQTYTTKKPKRLARLHATGEKNPSPWASIRAGR